MNRTLLCFLAAIFLAAWAPQHSSAQTYSGGSGSSGSPYLISSISDLETLATAVKGGNHYAGKYFKLTASIDISSNNDWTPIGYSFSETNNEPFRGIFDGDRTSGHVISGLTISTSSNVGKLGLFGYIGAGGKVMNLVLTSVNVNSTAAGHVGGVAGHIQGGTVDNCSVSGSVSGNQGVGGVVGHVYFGSSPAASTVSNCSSDATVSGVKNIGGVVGALGGTATKCYFTGTVTGSTEYAGGVVGSLYNSNSNLNNSYSTGTVKGGRYVGGVAGGSENNNVTNTITRCYATGAVSGNNYVGGVSGGGANVGNINNCAALNESVTATGANYARVVPGGGTLSGNFAWAEMPLNNSTVSSNVATNKNGKDCTAAAINADNTWHNGKFVAGGGWTTPASGNLPGLGGVDVPMPDHLLVPAAPSTLTATAGPGSGDVTLTWPSHASTNITYELAYGKATAPTNWATISVTDDGADVTYTVPGLDNGYLYYFLVRAVNRNIKGGAASEATATPVGAIAYVAITVTTPTAGGTPDVSAPAAGSNYTCSGVTWSDALDGSWSGNFANNVAYTASVTLTPQTNFSFTAGTTAKINVQDASVTLNVDGTITVTYTFAQTGAVFALTVVADPSAGGTAVDNTNTSPYGQGATISLTATANTGYRFVEWTAPNGSFDDADAASANFTMPPVAVTVTANFEQVFAVTYDPNGGSGTAPTETDKAEDEDFTVADATGLTAPSATQQFKEWNTQTDASGTVYAPGDQVTMPSPGAALTLYAIWENLYTVTYDPNGGSGTLPTETDKVAGEVFTAADATGLTVPSATQQFKEWNTQADGNGTAYAPGEDVTMPNAALTLYAIWENIYTVTYDLNGGSGTLPTETDKVENETFTAAASAGLTAPIGKQFKRWNTAANGSGTAYAAGATVTMPGSALTLYAIWENIPTTPAPPTDPTPDPDLSDIYAAIDLVQFTTIQIPQAAANTEAETRAWLEEYFRQQFNALNLYVSVSNISFSQFETAIAGTADNVNGTHGAVTFSAIFSKGNHSVQVSFIHGTIVATRFVTTGNEMVAKAALKAVSNGGMLVISGLTPGEDLRLYGTLGQLIYKGKQTASEAYIPLNVRGTLIVVSGNRTVKVLVK